METFSALLALCEGNPPVTGGFPSQKPVTRTFDVFFDQRLNKRLANTRDAGDLRRHCDHYYVIVMTSAVTVVTTFGSRTGTWRLYSQVLFCHTISFPVILCSINDITFAVQVLLCGCIVFVTLRLLLHIVFCAAHKMRFTHRLYDTKTLSTSMALCEGNPPVTGVFPSQMWTSCWTVDLPVVWNTTSMWRHRNG